MSAKVIGKIDAYIVHRRTKKKVQRKRTNAMLLRTPFNTPFQLLLGGVKGKDNYQAINAGNTCDHRKKDVLRKKITS